MPGRLSRYFPRTDPRVLARSILLARQCGVWTDDVRIPEDDLRRWMETLAQHGLVERAITYREIVDPRPAVWAMAE